VVAGEGKICGKCLRINTRIFGRIGQKEKLRGRFGLPRLVSRLFQFLRVVLYAEFCRFFAFLENGLKSFSWFALRGIFRRGARKNTLFLAHSTNPAPGGRDAGI
jgi:hypothetical protein